MPCTVEQTPWLLKLERECEAEFQRFINVSNRSNNYNAGFFSITQNMTEVRRKHLIYSVAKQVEAKLQRHF